MDRSSSQESLETSDKSQEVTYEKTALTAYVGFESILKQIEYKSLKRGFDFNILVAGQSGIGKTTFINTLFASHLVDQKGNKPNEASRKTTEITTRSHLVEEKGVKLRLTAIDTPGFGDLINNEKCWEPILQYILTQYKIYLKEETSTQRKKFIRDSRVHVCLYFISPNSHSLRPIDIETMKNLCEVTNLVPVLAKSDTLTLEERAELKKKINDELKSQKIRIYPSDYSDYEADEILANKVVTELIPFAVVGSEKSILLEGKAIAGRKHPWGVINVEDPSHCEFPHLRNFLMRTHLQDIIETTKFVHYETYRSGILTAKKKKKDGKSSKKV